MKEEYVHIITRVGGCPCEFTVHSVNFYSIKGHNSGTIKKLDKLKFDI